MNSRLRVLGETTYLGVNLMHFFILLCFGCFPGEGGNLGFWGDIPPGDIAGINTVCMYIILYKIKFV